MPASEKPLPMYDSIMEIEPVWRYCAGDYYPVQLNEQFCASRYRMCIRLASAPRPTIWLACDEQLSKYVAIKLAISGLDRPVESAVMRVLQDGEGNGSELHAGGQLVPEMLDDSKWMAQTSRVRGGDITASSLCQQE
jgi:serine/threonine-protein kinase SRPK3